jgi:hypothetical protein
MISKNTIATVSGVMASCMLTVAVSEFFHGMSPTEIHLITSAQLTAGSTIAPAGAVLVYSGPSYIPNAITEAEYPAVRDTALLRQDGLTYPTT